MKIKLTLFGLLGKKIPAFGSPEGVEMELPNDANAGYLLDHLKIPEEWKVAVIMDSRILKQNERLRDEAEIRIFQSVHGG
jgi:sulfur carrier protein ThiS